MRQAQEIRPELGLREDDQPGPQHRQIGSNGECEIQREIKDAVLAKMLDGQFLTGGRRGRNGHSIFWEAPPQLFHQFAHRHYLTDRNRVHPDCRHGLGLQPRRDLSQALAQTLAVFAVAPLGEYPIGQAGQQACCQQRAVKQVHEGRDILTASRTGQGTSTRPGRIL